MSIKVFGVPVDTGALTLIGCGIISCFWGMS